MAILLIFQRELHIPELRGMTLSIDNVITHEINFMIINCIITLIDRWVGRLTALLRMGDG